jgi:hypothetical protein
MGHYDGMEEDYIAKYREAETIIAKLSLKQLVALDTAQQIIILKRKIKYKNLELKRLEKIARKLPKPNSALVKNLNREFVRDRVCLVGADEVEE